MRSSNSEDSLYSEYASKFKNKVGAHFLDKGRGPMLILIGIDQKIESSFTRTCVGRSSFQPKVYQEASHTLLATLTYTDIFTFGATKCTRCDFIPN